MTIIEERILHSIKASVIRCPEKIQLPLQKETNIVAVQLSGDATGMLEVENAEGMDLTYQPEVLTAFERFGIAIVKGLESIKSDFPQYTDLIDKI